MARKTARPAAKPKKAFGRSLTDFGKLSVPEKKLIEACGLGRVCRLGDGKRPEKAKKGNMIRAGLIRFLALGGDDEAPVHENGIWLRGAYIAGHLDLASCRCEIPLVVHGSMFSETLTIVDASIPLLSLQGSAVPGIGGDRAAIKGDVFLNNGFRASGEVRFLGARIGGSLACTRGTFAPKEGHALSCDRAVIKGSVFLDEGFKATGEVLFLDARIGGSLACTGGTFAPEKGDALSCDGAAIKGDVFLKNGFRASGSVRFLGARIGGNLDCTGGTFAPKEGHALTCDGAAISGVLFFRYVKEVRGSVSLSGCHAHALADDRASWGKVPGLILDGFTYSRIVDGPTDATTRIAWLKRPMPKSVVNRNFRPQPWEQCIKALREMGHEADARQVAIAKQEAMREAGVIRGPMRRPLHWLYGVLAGYGYKPLNTILAMIIAWFACGVVYQGAGDSGLMAPSSAIVQTDERLLRICGMESWSRETQWTVCAALPQEYTTFSPYLYSLDLVLPLVDLQQDRDWAPIVMGDDGRTFIWPGVFIRFVMWFEILFGWAMSLLLVAVLGNLVKKD